MVPTDKKIELKACGRRDVQRIGLTAFREHASRNVGDGERFNCLADRMNRGLRSVEVLEDLFGFVGGGIINFGYNNVGNHTMTTNAVEKAIKCVSRHRFLIQRRKLLVSLER